MYLIQDNKQRQKLKVFLNAFRLHNHIARCHPQAQKLEKHNATKG